MRNTKKFMTFVESLVDDQNLLNIIKSGFNACLESIEYEGGDEWTIEIDELQYPVEIATKYFNLKENLLKYKQRTGEESVGKDSVTVGGRITVDYDFASIPYHQASMAGPEEGGLELNDKTVTNIELTLKIEGEDIETIIISDKKDIEAIDSVLDASIEKGINDRFDEILEETYENRERDYKNDIPY